MYRKIARIRRALILLLSISLLFSFALHSLRINHTHFGTEHLHGHEHSGEIPQLSEYMHLADKKLFSIALLMFLAPWTFLPAYVLIERRLRLSLQARMRARLRRLHREWCRTFEFLMIFFQKGILHTKVF